MRNGDVGVVYFPLNPKSSSLTPEIEPLSQPMSRRKPTRTIVVIATLTGAATLLFVSGVMRPITSAVAGVVLKIAGPLYSAGATITREPADKALESLQVENAKLKMLLAENDTLKTALGFKERTGDNAVLARVVSRTSDDIFHGLVIDRGTEDGIAADQPVIFGDGIIIGKIIEVKPRSASVLLLTDTRSKLAVSIENAKETTGVLEGDRGLSMMITLIPQTEAVAVNDVIVTSGIEPGIRRGLVIGTIEKVSRETQDPFQTAVVVPFHIASAPTFVQVLRNTMPSVTK